MWSLRRVARLEPGEMDVAQGVETTRRPDRVVISIPVRRRGAMRPAVTREAPKRPLP